MNETYSFIGGKTGAWRVMSATAVRGPGLEIVDRIDVVDGWVAEPPEDTGWVLRGRTSNLRYSTRAEVSDLRMRQPGLNRPEALCAALIPIRKSAPWWELAQDERRTLFEAISHHTAIGLEYLPAIARRLHHCRDLGEPFDFVTWFEYAPEHAKAFEELVQRLRSTQEWNFVEREVDIRLERIPP